MLMKINDVQEKRSQNIINLNTSDYDLNKLQFTLSEDASIQLFWPRSVWEDFWKIPPNFQ